MKGIIDKEELDQLNYLVNEIENVLQLAQNEYSHDKTTIEEVFDAVDDLILLNKAEEIINYDESWSIGNLERLGEKLGDLYYLSEEVETAKNLLRKLAQNVLEFIEARAGHLVNPMDKTKSMTMCGKRVDSVAWAYSRPEEFEKHGNCEECGRLYMRMKQFFSKGMLS